jgi:hypothetical protein
MLRDLRMLLQQIDVKCTELDEQGMFGGRADIMKDE